MVAVVGRTEAVAKSRFDNSVFQASVSSSSSLGASPARTRVKYSCRRRQSRLSTAVPGALGTGFNSY